jgi:large subunit ribosomal protein L30
MATKKSIRRARAIEDLTRSMSPARAVSDKAFRLTLRRSAIGGTERQRATLQCLGLRRRGAQATVKDTPQARGRIRAVAHLVVVEEV